MANRIKEYLEKIRDSDKGLKVLIALGLVGVMLIMLSEFIPSKETKTEEAISSDYTYAEYTESLENRTQKLISSIQGVGRCQVMITLKDTNESVYAKNSEENQSDSSYSKSDEYVLYEGQSGKAPVLIKQRFPEIQGIAVVCDGADNTVVRESVINSVSSLFGVSVNKISVSKYKG